MRIENFVHKSYIVTPDKIEYFEHNHLYMAGRKIPVSNTYKLSLQEHLKKPEAMGRWKRSLLFYGSSFLQ